MNALRLASIDDGRPGIGPETIHIDVTNGCNTNCITCWDHSPLLTIGRNAAWKRRRVTVEGVEDILDDAQSLRGLKAVILSGMGEPFTHPDIYRMITVVKARRLHLTIITNLVAADADQILALDVDQLLVGVHAASERAYLAFHPSFRPAEWDRLRAMLRQLRDAGKRYKHVQVVCRVNADELPDMVRFAHEHRAAQVSFKLASLRGGTEDCRIDEAQRARLVAELVPEAARVAGELGVATNLDVFAAQLGAGGGATAPIADVGCFMGYYYARITVDGTVLYCCNTDVVVGSLADARFADQWRGEAWQALRDRLRGGAYLPSCDQCGKLNQNVNIGRAFAAAYGDGRLRQVTGR